MFSESTYVENCRETLFKNNYNHYGKKSWWPNRVCAPAKRSLTLPVEKILLPVMFVQHFIVVFHFHYFSNKCREFVYLFYEMLRANFNLMSSMTCCFLLFFFFLVFFFSVLKPEKAAQATSADLKQVVMGNAGCALCTSRAPCADLTDTATLPRRDLSLTSHTHTPRVSHLRTFLSLSVFHFAVTGLWRRSQSPPSNTRAADEQFSGVIDGVNIWNCLLFSLSSSWQMRFKLSSSVTLSSCAPRPSPCPALPLIYWSQSPYAATNGVTYHEGFRQLGILSPCSLSTQSALFHQAGRRALQKRPRISAALHAEEEKRAHCPFFTEAPWVVQSRRKVQHTSGRVQKNKVLMLLCFSDGHNWARYYVSRPW